MKATNHTSRRSLLRAVFAAGVGVVLGPRRVRAAAGRFAHPTPRPGITGANVLTAADLAKSPHLVDLFDGIRAIPHIADGIGCHCGCAELGHYSLLTCYEREAMARSCPICQGEGRVTVRMAKAGKSLAEIRVAIDAQFG